MFKDIYSHRRARITKTQVAVKRRLQGPDIIDIGNVRVPALIQGRISVFEASRNATKALGGSFQEV